VRTTLILCAAAIQVLTAGCAREKKESASAPEPKEEAVTHVIATTPATRVAHRATPSPRVEVARAEGLTSGPTAAAGLTSASASGAGDASSTRARGLVVKHTGPVTSAPLEAVRREIASINMMLESHLSPEQAVRIRGSVEQMKTFYVELFMGDEDFQEYVTNQAAEMNKVIDRASATTSEQDYQREITALQAYLTSMEVPLGIRTRNF
jgi:hypothetical protein